ncbi:MAG: PASTA domain-containing protein [Deltaproteobacteria bacterium]|nr:PASTA domain-containing protein [Deltaproteobacteria bacterium]
MDDEEFDVPGLPKARKRAVANSATDTVKTPSRGGNVLLTVVIAAATSVGTVTALQKLRPVFLQAPSPAFAIAASSPAPVAPGAAVARVRVPELRGVALENVHSVAASLGLRLVVREGREASTFAAGTVAGQAPMAASEVSPQSELVVVLSSGPNVPLAPIAERVDAGVIASDAGTAGASGELIAVPSVVRLHVGEARARLDLAGLILRNQRRGYDTDIAPGRILRQSPASGTRVARGSGVDIVVNAEAIDE